MLSPSNRRIYYGKNLEDIKKLLGEFACSELVEPEGGENFLEN